MTIELPLPGYDQCILTVSMANFPRRKLWSRALPRVVSVDSVGPWGDPYVHHVFRWAWLRIDWYRL